jgi:hypothetical protein
MGWADECIGVHSVGKTREELAMSADEFHSSVARNLGRLVHGKLFCVLPASIGQLQFLWTKRQSFRVATIAKFVQYAPELLKTNVMVFEERLVVHSADPQVMKDLLIKVLKILSADPSLHIDPERMKSCCKYVVLFGQVIGHGKIYAKPKGKEEAIYDQKVKWQPASVHE